MDRGEIPMEHGIGEFTMEPMRTSSPGRPPWIEERSPWRMEESSPWSLGEQYPCSQGRGRSHKYSSTSLYNTDRTARIKAMSSEATQTNSFQDHLDEEFSELVHTDSFQDPSYLAAADNLEEFSELVHIDSFQDPSYLAAADNLEEN